MPELNQLVVPVPPIDVQKDIVRAIGEFEARHHSMRSALTRQVSLLKERRQALISAAVVGELDIPGVAA
jgi:type I restriction enzyme S subunit